MRGVAVEIQQDTRHKICWQVAQRLAGPYIDRLLVLCLRVAGWTGKVAETWSRPRINLLHQGRAAKPGKEPPWLARWRGAPFTKSA